MNLDSFVSRFKFLGMTEYQARVLYGLLKNKSCSISDLSKISEVPNTRVYDVVKQLMTMDYVIKISDKPKLYKIRNSDSVIEDILSKFENKMKKIRAEADEMKSYFRDDLLKHDDKILKVDNEIDLIKILHEEMSNATNSIVGFSSNEILNKNIQNTLNKALKNDVDVKLIVNSSNSVSNLKDNIKLKDHNLLAYVIDSDKVVMRVSKDDDEHHNITLVKGHQGMKDMIINHFNSNWND